MRMCVRWRWCGWCRGVLGCEKGTREGAMVKVVRQVHGDQHNLSGFSGFAERCKNRRTFSGLQK